jgi:hypothetical protein
MPATIKQACDLDGCCILSEGSLKPADIIPKLLAALEELAPAVHQQLTMPGCGFTMVPAYAMDDHTSDWWDGKECDGAIAALIEALEEHAPEGFEFRAMHGDDGTEYRYDRIEHEWPTPAEAFDRWRNQYNEPESEAEAEPEECEDNDCAGCPWCDRRAALLKSAPDQNVLDSMFNWHGGQGSALYAAASCWLGGHDVTRETAERALAELDRFSSQPNFSADDAEVLEQLRAHVEAD